MTIPIEYQGEKYFITDKKTWKNIIISLLVLSGWAIPDIKNI